MELWYDGSFDLHGVGVRGVDTWSLAHTGLTRDHLGPRRESKILPGYTLKGPTKWLWSQGFKYIPTHT